MIEVKTNGIIESVFSTDVVTHKVNQGQINLLSEIIAVCSDCNQVIRGATLEQTKKFMGVLLDLTGQAIELVPEFTDQVVPPFLKKYLDRGYLQSLKATVNAPGLPSIVAASEHDRSRSDATASVNTTGSSLVTAHGANAEQTNAQHVTIPALPPTTAPADIAETTRPAAVVVINTPGALDDPIPVDAIAADATKASIALGNTLATLGNKTSKEPKISILPR